MSEAYCNGCKGSKYASSGMKLSTVNGNVCNICSSSTDANDCCVTKSRVQVRAKVLYGSGTAIANLRAKEKAANRSNL